MSTQYLSDGFVQSDRDRLQRELDEARAELRKTDLSLQNCTVEIARQMNEITALRERAERAEAQLQKIDDITCHCTFQDESIYDRVARLLVADRQEFQQQIATLAEERDGKQELIGALTQDRAILLTRCKELEADNAKLRAALVEAAIPMESLMASHRHTNYTELSVSMIFSIQGAIEQIRVALAEPAQDAGAEQEKS